MKKTKQQLIEEFCMTPLQVGQSVIVKIPYQQTTIKKVKVPGKRSLQEDIIVTDQLFRISGTVFSINDDQYEVDCSYSNTRIPTELDNYFKGHKKTGILPKEFVFHDCYYIGVDPFAKDDWNSNIRFRSLNIDSLLWELGYDRRRNQFRTDDKLHEVYVPEVNWNPSVINESGEETFYQRDFCWTLKEKQLLIDSIYNHIEIGKIVMRKRSYHWVENRVKKGLIENTSFKDIVDGKQRCKTILDFVESKFPDSYGNYFKDLSDRSQQKFFGYGHLTFGELGETSTDKDVLHTFLNINYTGVPMSQDHINFVKNIKL